MHTYAYSNMPSETLSPSVDALENLSRICDELSDTCVPLCQPEYFLTLPPGVTVEDYFAAQKRVMDACIAEYGFDDAFALIIAVQVGESWEEVQEARALIKEAVAKHSKEDKPSCDTDSQL